MEQSVSGVGVIDKAMSLVSAVEAEPRTLAELIEATGMSRATTHRLALALEAHGVLGRDSEGRFHLGPRCIALGQLAVRSVPVAEASERVLSELRDDCGESTQLYVRQGDERVCLVARDSPHELRTIVAPGAVLPLGRGSAGRILAGEASGTAGWIESVEDRAPGVASVSAAVRLDGRIVGAISVSGPVERIGPSPGERHGVKVVRAAHAVEQALQRLIAR